MHGFPESFKLPLEQDPHGPSTALMGNAARLHQIKPKDYVEDGVGLPTVTDILAELEKPGRDPRPAFRTATFAEGVGLSGRAWQSRDLFFTP